MKSHKAYTVVIISALLALFLGLLSVLKRESVKPALTEHTESGTLALDRQKVLATYGKLPLLFEPNLGQTDDRVQFVSRGEGFSLLLTDNGATLVLKDRRQQKAGEQTSAFHMELVGANRQARSYGIERAQSSSNYFAGNDPDKWQTSVPNFHKVSYEQIYPGVDLVYYGNGRQLEFDFIVAPESDSTQIALKFEGVDNLEIAESGDLVLSIGGEQIIQKKPYAYQDIDGARREIQASYKSLASDQQSLNQSVGFEIGDYNRTKPLVIDPVLVYSSYLGGIGFDQGYAIAVDSSGNTYLTGRTGTSTFPTTTGAFDTTYNGSTDSFITKINAAGNALVYSTYIGGSVGNAIAVDSSGNAYITGEALGPFPTTAGAFETPHSGYDTFILKLNPSGSALVYSSRFGGDFDDFGRDIAVDGSGNAFITGWTVCRTPTCTFPVVNAFQPNYGGGYNDGFVTKMNPTGSALVYSTYLGGGQILNNTEDWGASIAVDSAGSAFVTGYTYSPDFPVTAGAFDTDWNGLDAFVTKFAPNGQTLVYSTFLGGFQREQGQAIAVDNAGNAYVAGTTESLNFPTTPGAFQTTGNFDAFVTKLNPNGSALVYSTYLGGSEDAERAWGIAIDNAGNAYIAGDTKSIDFPVVDAIQPNYGDGLIDAFVSKLNPTGTALVYSTYLGGNLFDEGRGIAVDGSGSAYITGYTSSYDFPVTAGVFQVENAGGLEHHDDAFVVKIQGQQIQTRRTLFDFDGDGKADVSVFRPSVSIWYLLRSQAGFTATQWGISSDMLAPADFDGDGKTDIAVYRDGMWYLQRSALGFATIVHGSPSDIPQPADFDGDGKAELAVFRPSTGTWYVLNLVNNQFTAFQFGASTDKPVVGDYDGDGKADCAVYRDGAWYLQQSSLGFLSIAFGVSTDKPVPADYDGDGKTDVAVFRPSNGTWYLQQSANGFKGVQFGMATDLPEPADYDGDGKTDIAVFRDGTWYQLKSTQGFASVQFGATNDIPIPSSLEQ